MFFLQITSVRAAWPTDSSKGFSLWHCELAVAGRELVTLKAQWPHSWGALQCSCVQADVAREMLLCQELAPALITLNGSSGALIMFPLNDGKHLRELLLHMGRMLILIFPSSFSGLCFSLNYLSCAEGFITVWQVWFIPNGNKGGRMCLLTSFQNMHVQIGKTLRKGEKTLL